MSPRTYLLSRFHADAVALRERAALLRGAPSQPGPDAATSMRMADACDDVIAMIDAIPERTEALETVEALTSLVPLLEDRAKAAGDRPPVRAVYAGAATRIREIADAERRHHDPLAASADHDTVGHDEDDDGEDDDGEDDLT
jgi:hypothetical protein